MRSAVRAGPAAFRWPEICPMPVSHSPGGCLICQPVSFSFHMSGRPVHRPFRGLLGVHSRYGLHTRAVTVYRDTLIEGFSHFVTSMTAPVASGWSVRRVGLAPTGKRRLYTAHAESGPPKVAREGPETRP